MEWTMIVASKQVVEGGWGGEALRLRSFLDTISNCMPPEYNEPLIWRDEDLTAEQWSDPAEITAELERQRMRNPDGTIAPGADSGGVVQAYRNGMSKVMINNMWDVGGDHEWQLNAVLSFYTGSIADGEAKSLVDSPVEWLVKLMSRVCASVNAADSRIETDDLADELIEARRGSAVGAITLAPNGIGDARLPASITAYPCTEGYPNGLVLVADLQRAANDPASLVADLLVVDDIIHKDND